MYNATPDKRKSSGSIGVEVQEEGPFTDKIRLLKIDFKDWVSRYRFAETTSEEAGEEMDKQSHFGEMELLIKRLKEIQEEAETGEAPCPGEIAIYIRSLEEATSPEDQAELLVGWFM